MEINFGLGATNALMHDAKTTHITGIETIDSIKFVVEQM